MKKILTIVACVGLAALLLYFSPLNRLSSVHGPAEEVVIEDAPPASQISAPATVSVPSAASDQMITGQVTKAGSSVTSLEDGSSITTVEDGKGNRVESRFMDSDRQIRGVVVNTAADGSKQVRIMLADGSSRLLPSEPVPDVIKASPSQIASALGIFGDLTVKRAPTPVVDPNPEPSPSPEK